MVADAYKQRALWLVLLAVVCDYIGVSMMRVTLPFFAKALGGSATLVGGIESCYGVGQVCGALILPKLSDRWGRRAILTFSCFGSLVGYSLAVTARYVESPMLLLASRIPVGLAKQTVTVSRAVVADCTEANEERSKWMSWLGTALGIGCVVGPFCGGQAAERLGDIMPAILSCGVFAIMTPVVFMFLPETAPDTGATKAAEKKEEKPLEGKPVWQSGSVLVVLAVLMIPELGLIAYSSVTLYSFAIDELSKGKAWLGNLTAGSAVFQAFFAGVMPILTTRGWSDKAVMHLGVLSFAVCCLTIWHGHSENAVYIAAPIGALANAVLRSYPATLLSKQVVEARQGEAMGSLDLCSSGIRIIAPVLFGWIMTNYGNGNAFVCQAALFVFASACLFAHSLLSGGKGGKVAAD